MIYVVSKVKNSKKRIYHKPGCIYEKRIKLSNRKMVSLEQAEKRKYCECTYCSGLRGEVRVSQKQIKKWKKKNGLTFNYYSETDTLYINSDIGFWKIYMLDEYKEYVLYHRNVYSEGMDFYEAINGSFHRQKDVKAMDSIEEIIKYIALHDEAKKIINEDYRKLPTSSKQQKKYYESARKKDKKKKIRSLWFMLDSISLGDDAYKEKYYMKLS